MKKFLLPAFLLYSFGLDAQNIPKPKKNYEYQDTRRKNESFAKLPPDLKAEVSTFTFTGIDEGIKKEQLLKVSFSAISADSILFNVADIKVTIKTAPFEPSKTKIDYDEGYPIRINKKPYYGGFGTMPKKFINNFLIVMGKDTVVIPPAAYADLYNLNFDYTDKGTKKSVNGIYRSANTHRLYLYLFCKDNTGSYEVTWIIYDKKFVRRILDYGFM
jgi:hypothetical protein